MITVKTISIQEANKLVLEFSKEKSLINLDEIDIKPLCNDKSILLIETDSIENILDDITYCSVFKCCFIEGPESLSMTDTQKIVNQLPTVNTVFGINIAKELHIYYLVNSLY